MIFELLTLAALLMVDATGDAHGAGDLAPPTAPIYASLAPFDLVEVSVLDEPQLAVEIILADIPNSLQLPLGLSLPVIDVYLDTADGGEERLLPGPGLRMPDGVGWEIALRVHGDDAYLVDALQGGSLREPLSVRRVGNGIVVRSSRAAPLRVRRLDAMTGVYDAFSADAWRGLSSVPSPWAFSSGRGSIPVVDLLAPTGEAQRTALETGVLPALDGGALRVVAWLVVSTVGVIVSLSGLLWRGRRQRSRPGGGSDAGVALIGVDEVDAWPSEADVPAEVAVDGVTASHSTSRDGDASWGREGAAAWTEGVQASPPSRPSRPSQADVAADSAWVWERGANVDEASRTVRSARVVTDDAGGGAATGRDRAARPAGHGEGSVAYRVREGGTGTVKLPPSAGGGGNGDADDRRGREDS